MEISTEKFPLFSFTATTFSSCLEEMKI